MKTINRGLVAVAVLVLAVVIALSTSHLFRSETYDNPAIGLITTHYRWGRSAWQTVDTDRDGTINARARIDGGGYLEEYWEDADSDGVFDRHVLMDGTCIRRIEFDHDGDGDYEQYIEGEEARTFYERNRPKVLSMGPCPPIY